MFVAPADLDEGVILAAVRAGWTTTAESVSYLPVGFGSHHWRTDGPGHQTLLVTVDDLDKTRCHIADTRDAAFARLAGAFGAARALQQQAGVAFVVAPLPDTTGSVILRLADGYSLVVHPFLPGHPAGGETFASNAERNAVVDLLVVLHRSTDVAAGHAHREDAAVRNGDVLIVAVDDLGHRWDSGPYGEPARRLLATHARDLGLLLDAYDKLAPGVIGGASHLIITHGEPNATNVIVNHAGLHLVDWESARLAPPERDLWSLAQEDPSILDRYATGAGRPVNLAAITFYRLWYDLFEIAGYLKTSWRRLRSTVRSQDTPSTGGQLR